MCPLLLPKPMRKFGSCMQQSRKRKVSVWFQANFCTGKTTCGLVLSTVLLLDGFPNEVQNSTVRSRQYFDLSQLETRYWTVSRGCSKAQPFCLRDNATLEDFIMMELISRMYLKVNSYFFTPQGVPCCKTFQLSSTSCMVEDSGLSCRLIDGSTVDSFQNLLKLHFSSL